MDQETYEERNAFAVMKAAEYAQLAHHLSPEHPHMSRKRFKKLMMAEGMPRNIAEHMCEGIGVGNGTMGYFDLYIWIIARRSREFLDFIVDNTIKIGEG